MTSHIAHGPTAHRAPTCSRGVARHSRGWLIASLWVATTACGDGTPDSDGAPAPDADDTATETPIPSGDGNARDASTSAPSERADRPNLLVICWDTVRADRLSLYGYPRPTTPGLERLAQRATVYDHAVSPGMWTIPTHGSLFTGAPVSAHGASERHKWLDHGTKTLAERLQEVGYETYAFSANPFVSKSTNLTQGFEFVEHPWDGRWKAQVLEHIARKQIEGDQSGALSPERAEDVAALERKGLFKEAGPVIATALLDWLETRDPRTPYFAYLNYMEAHTPRLPSMRAREAVMSDAEVRRSLELDQRQAKLLAAMLGQHEYDEADRGIISKVYDASLIDLDRETSRLLQSLRKGGHLDNTVVVLLADHGEHLGDRGLYGHKFSVDDPLTHVPLMVCAPGRFPTGTRVSTMVSTLDVYATLLQLGGVEDGHGQARGLPTSNDALRPHAYSELVAVSTHALERVDRDFGSFEWAPWLRTYDAVEDGTHKLIVASDGTTRLTTRSQPGIDLPDDPVITARLREELARWKASFDPYDPSTATDADRSRGLSDELKERLRALGYWEEEDEDEDEDEDPAKDANPSDGG